MTRSDPEGSDDLRDRLFRAALILLGGGFALFFVLYVAPPLFPDMDVAGAFAAGFVNPFAAGYSTDTIMCWFVLASWIVYEKAKHGVKHGWIPLLLGLVPGVATGFALYLLIRMRQGRAVA
jgi:hypothetical protein